MSNKIVKSKKKNTISKHNRIDKNKKSIIVCLAFSFVISLLLSGIYFNSNYIDKYQSVWYEASITDYKGYNIEVSWRLISLRMKSFVFSIISSAVAPTLSSSSGRLFLNPLSSAERNSSA